MLSNITYCLIYIYFKKGDILELTNIKLIMIISELKKDAKLKLSGKWGKAVLITFLYILIFGALESTSTLFENAVLNSFYSLFISIICIPFSYGYLAQIIKLSRGEEVKMFDFITIGLQSFKKVYAVLGRTIQKLILPIIAFTAATIFFIIAFTFQMSTMVSSVEPSYTGLFVLSLVLFIAVIIYWIVKVLSYELTSYILLDNADLSAKEIVEKSEELMKNNKLNYFKLALSFIGWYLLVCLACMIPIVGFIAVLVAYAFLSPYITISLFNFYEDLNDNVISTPTEKTDNENDDENIDPIKY